jgi:hypothetical protein
MATKNLKVLEQSKSDRCVQEFTFEQIDKICLNISLCHNIADVLRSVNDIGGLADDTICGLMHLQQEKLDEVRDILHPDGKK